MPSRRKGKKGGTASPAAKESAGGAVALGGYLFASETTQHLAQATDNVFRDATALQKVINDYANCDPSLVQGRAFEFLEVLKFNREAALQGSDLSAVATHYTDPASAADILIQKAGSTVGEVQAKSYEHAAQSLRALAKEKYQGMQRLVPSDQVDGQADLLAKRLQNAPPDQLNRPEYQDIQENLSGKLRSGNVESPGTSRVESDAAVNNPAQTVLTLKGTQALEEIGKAGLTGAAVGGGMGLLFHGMMNAYHAKKGHKTNSEAIIDTVKGTASVAARSGVVTAGAKTIAIAARQTGLSGFAAGAGPAVVANAVLEAGLGVHRYIKGEIGGDELKEQVGGAVLRGGAAYYCGIAGQVLIPIPVVGALVGSIVGYTASAVLLQAGILGAGPSNMVENAKKRRKEIEAMCFETVKRMELERAEIMATSKQYDLDYNQRILPAMDIFESALALSHPMAAMNALADLNEAFGSSLPFRNLKEFDEWMEDPDTVLQL